ncbi:MAG TPA: ankyrin repeat domain-containing protein, partial [Acidimicrobiales bacterium]|nr:ankyrin repeat domain-containing protein [Acidimicrobiales bacterium]
SRSTLNPGERLLAACMAGDAAKAEDLATYDPTIPERARAARPHAILEATEIGRAEAVRLLASHGFDVNARKRITALHQAAYDGNVELVELLLDLGADPTISSADFNSPPLNWAEHARQEATAAILRPLTPR